MTKLIVFRLTPHGDPVSTVANIGMVRQLSRWSRTSTLTTGRCGGDRLTGRSPDARSRRGAPRSSRPCVTAHPKEGPAARARLPIFAERVSLEVFDDPHCVAGGEVPRESYSILTSCSTVLRAGGRARPSPRAGAERRQEAHEGDDGLPAGAVHRRRPLPQPPGLGHTRRTPILDPSLHPRRHPPVPDA